MTMGSGTGANGSLEAREGVRLTTTRPRPTARPVTGGVPDDDCRGGDPLGSARFDFRRPDEYR